MAAPSSPNALGQLLEEFQVTALLSPPNVPRYNGPVEAGMGPGTIAGPDRGRRLLTAHPSNHRRPRSRAGPADGPPPVKKVRATYEAMQDGRFGHWTCDDVEGALLPVNLASHPWGPLGPTPQQRWDQRTPLTAQQRTAFLQCLLDSRPQVLHELDLVDDDTLTDKERATVARSTTRRALETLGCLSTRRRRITPPVNSHLRDRISQWVQQEDLLHYFRPNPGAGGRT